MRLGVVTCASSNRGAVEKTDVRPWWRDGLGERYARFDVWSPFLLEFVLDCSFRGKGGTNKQTNKKQIVNMAVRISATVFSLTGLLMYISQSCGKRQCPFFLISKGFVMWVDSSLYLNGKGVDRIVDAFIIICYSSHELCARACVRACVHVCL